MTRNVDGNYSLSGGTDCFLRGGVKRIGVCICSRERYCALYIQNGQVGGDKAAVRWLRVNNAYERGHRARERGRGAPFLAVRIHLSRSTGANCIGYFCGVDRVSMRSMRSVPGEWPRWLPLEGSAVDYLSAIGFSSVSVHLGAA